jgi:hypothetical protein
VRVDGNGIRASRDGRNFDREPKQPGSFFFGLTHDRLAGPAFAVRVRTPRTE